MRDLFLKEAEKNRVFPLDDRYVERAMPENRPQPNAGRTSFPGVARITGGMALNMKDGSYTITAEVEIPEGGAEGVLMTQSGFFGGNALPLMDGKLDKSPGEVEKLAWTVAGMKDDRSAIHPAAI